jgi:hypothetical protein
MQAVRKVERLRFSGAFSLGSGEPGSECCRTEEVDGPDDVVGQHAQRGFAADLLSTSAAT